MPEANAITVHCRHAGECPGCPLIGRAYGEQLTVKRLFVAEALGRYSELGGVAAEETVGADPITGYRTRAKLVVSGARVGLFRAHSHDVVDIPDCRVQGPSVATVIAAVRRALPMLGIPVRAVDARSAGDTVLLTLVVPEGTTEEAMRRAAERLGGESLGGQAAALVSGISISLRDEASAQVLGRPPVTVVGRDRIRSRLSSESPFHFVAPGTFAQAHAGQERVLVRAIVVALEASRPGARLAVLDLSSGIGVGALELASRGHDVVAVESYGPSATACREAASAQGLAITVEAQDATTALRRLVQEGRRFDAVVVNPPRYGLSPELRADLGKLSPPCLVYVSCEPLSLARDLADLARRGLRPTALRPHDMMPLSAEVETLAVLTPHPAPEPVVLHRDDRLVVVSKAPHEPTTPQGEHERPLLERIRRMTGCESAVVVHRLDIGTSGACLFATSPEHVPRLSAALASSEKEYLALVRGITRDRGTIRRPLRERGRSREACTRYVRCEVVGGQSLLSVRPDQGYKHQVRRHLASIGHPVIGDERYGHAATNQFFSRKHLLDRPFLHCARITWSHEGHDIDVAAPLAGDLAGVLTSCRGRKQP